MQVSIRGNPGRLRSSMSFATSGWVHGSILAWLAFSPGPPASKPRSLYEQEIQPYEKHLVWYSVKDRLPDISPSAASHKTEAPRARTKFHQTIVAGTKDTPGPHQMIQMPAPEIKLPDPLPLPNVVAVAPPAKPLRTFLPPLPKRVASAPAPLPDAPRVTPKMDARSLPFDASVAKPKPRAFTPPPSATPKPVTLAPLPDAPAVTAAVRDRPLPIALPNPRAPLRTFSPPPSKAQSNAPVGAALPDAPTVAAAVEERSLPLALPNPRAPLRAFTAPPAGVHTKTATPDDLPAVPEVSGATTAASTVAQSTLAIVGLTPSKIPDFPTPPGSRQAGFSGGPRPKGEDGGTEGNALIVVPGLLARGGDKDKQPTLVAHASSPTSRENLLAAARAALNNPTLPAGTPTVPNAMKVSSAPDPRLEGRTVYSVAIQMPNITSYSGSWMVWFADRQPPQGGPPPQIRPPLPMRKVDPKYVAAALEEKVEGVVRLFAVIRKDGSVESVSLLRHLDDRLDRSAQEALAKWTFEPALRNGVPMDVDAVFEVPFRLAKPVK